MDVGLVFTPFFVVGTSLSSNAGKIPVCPFMLLMGDLDLLMTSEVPLEATSTLPSTDLAVSVDLGVLGLPLGVFTLILGVLGWFKIACRLAYSAKNSSSCRSRYNCVYMGKQRHELCVGRWSCMLANGRLNIGK